ncbi:GNAT family N-acetyltransferase [Aliidiomarina sp. Khilg15.8]
MSRLLALITLFLPLVAWGAWDDIEAADDYHGTWYIERLQAEHNRAYFDAAQSSQAMLFNSLGWGWPSSKSSAERNLDTMHFHAGQHDAGEVYSYVLLGPDRELHGAVFLSPVQPRPGLPGFNAARFQLEVTFWVNEAGQSAEVAPELLADILQWLREDWDVRNVLFPIATSNDFARTAFSSHDIRLLRENNNADEVLYQFRAR